MERKTIIRSDNHVCLDGWMINELELSGSELIVFALIWGFTQDGNQWCTASQAYIARWANISTRGLRKILDKLESKGLLIKETNICSKGLECKYRAIRPSTEEQETDRNFVPVRSEQSSCQVGTMFPSDGNIVPIRSEQSSYNNIEDNIENNIENNIFNQAAKRKSEAELKQDFEELWKLYPRKEGKKDAFNYYKKAIKNGTTNEEIRRGIENYKAWLKAKNETNYIKQGSTFFSKESWTDEYDLTTVDRGDPFDVRNQYWDTNDPTVH